MAETFRKSKVNQVIAQIQAQVVDIERLIRSGQLSSEESKTHQLGRKDGLLDALDAVYEVFGIDAEVSASERTLGAE